MTAYLARLARVNYRPTMRMLAHPSPLLPSKHPFLDGIEPAFVTRLFKEGRWIEVEAGETVIDFDDANTEVFLVLQGTLRVLVRTADGKRTQIFGDYAAGEMIGELAAIDDKPRSAHVVALVRTRLCVVPAPTFVDTVCSSRAACLWLLRLLTSRIRGQSQRLLEYAVLPMNARLVAELLRLSRDRADGSRVVTPPPTQEELAARIGTRRETVSRDLAKLCRDGLLSRTRAAIVLRDVAALRAMVDDGLA